MNIAISSMEQMLKQAVDVKLGLFREQGRDATSLHLGWLKYRIRYDVTPLIEQAGRGYISHEELSRTAAGAVKKLALAIVNDPDITYIPDPCSYCGSAIGRDPNGQCSTCGGSA